MIEKYIFIDESGDPQFYARQKRPLWIEPGFVPVIFLGMVVTKNKSVLRKSVSDFKTQILNDPLLNSIYSVRQAGWYLHACNDHSDINLKMVEFLRQLNGFEFYAVIGRKIPEIFTNKHNGNATEFYFDLIHKLLQLDDMEPNSKYHLYLSKRQSNTEQRFTKAFEKAVAAKANQFSGFSYSCSVVGSMDHPEMSVVDYLLWALQRYILKGEKRYFTALEKHYVKILDLYENGGKGRLYDASDHFDLLKASSFKIY